VFVAVSLVVSTRRVEGKELVPTEQKEEKKKRDKLREKEQQGKGFHT
jgi:hypothetical protein